MLKPGTKLRRALLLAFLLFSTGPTVAQQLLWTQKGVGPNPHLTMLRADGKAELVLVGSPYSSRLRALEPEDGSQRWKVNVHENVARPGRLVADIAFIATHEGSLVALDSNDGAVMWSVITERRNDFAALQPVYIEGSVYTMTLNGVLSRFSLTGERLRRVKVDPRVDGWMPRLVPMWRDAKGLSYLDQSGRLRTFHPETLALMNEFRVKTAPGPGNGSGSEVLAGVFDAGGEMLYTVELSGRLRSSSLVNGETWNRYIGEPNELWSDSGRVLAVPVMASGGFAKLLVVTRSKALAMDRATGVVEKTVSLPSPAVAPPVYDGKRKTWWVVTQDALVELNWAGSTRVLELPEMTIPYTAALTGDLLVLADAQGLLYGFSLSEFGNGSTEPGGSSEPEE